MYQSNHQTYLITCTRRTLWKTSKYISISICFSRCRFLSIYTYVYMYIYKHSSPFDLARVQSQYLMVVERDDGLSTLCHTCGFPSEQRVLKTFPGPRYLCSENRVVWLRHFLVIWIYMAHHFILPRHNLIALWWLGGTVVWALGAS